MIDEKTYVGRIVKALAGFYYIRRQGDGIVYACRARGIFRKRKYTPLVGDVADFVITHEGDKEGNIVALHERSSVLVRPTVANVDLVLVVFALRDPQPNLRLMDRLLAMLEQVGMSIVICFNKVDLAENREIQDYRSIYEAAGYSVTFISTLDRTGQTEVEEAIRGHLATVAGPSGAGKSSLINQLCHKKMMETGAVSAKIKRGKQTTRHIELLEVADDTYVVDTPGFSSLDFMKLSKEELENCFPEIKCRLGQCRYSSCSHVHEPVEDCGIRTAVALGNISQERYESYRVFYEELEAIRRY